jgi:hypothetical protein
MPPYLIGVWSLESTIKSKATAHIQKTSEVEHHIRYDPRSTLGCIYDHKHIDKSTIFHVKREWRRHGSLQGGSYRGVLRFQTDIWLALAES